MNRVSRAFVLLSFLPLSAIASAAESNLLVITIDTLRADRLSCYSRAFVKTPAIDALAAKGVLFEKAFALCPTTLPSHVNIMSGMTPLFHGVHENSKAKVPGDCLTIAEHLKAQGYATAAFIAAFPLNARFGLNKGFDVYDDRLPYKPPQLGTSPERRAQDVVAAAMAWISARKGKWFCWIHLWDPHTPYAPPEPFQTEYRNDPYSGEAAYVDAELRVLFEGLQSREIMEKTLIVITADHGESLGEHGELTHSYFAYNSTIHVPLIISGPGVRPSRVTGNVAHVDIFPTVCDLLGLPKPRGLQGRSLAAAMKGEALKDRPIYFESLEPYLNDRVAPLRGVIEGRIKYMDSPVPEVYDLAADFQEKENLVGKMDLGPFKKKLDALMKAFLTPRDGQGKKVVDRETLERLRSLGYVASPLAQVKSSYGPEDDLKNFLTFKQKLEQAVLLIDKGDMEESIRQLTALIRQKPSFVPAYIYLSQVLHARGRLPEALRLLEDGVRANPDDYTPLSALGTLFIESGRWDSALEVLEKALGIIDYDPEIWDNMGIAHLMKGDYPKAVEDFDKALFLDPTFALALANMGRVYQLMFIERGQKPDDISHSIDYFQKALAQDPAFALGWRGLGGSFWAAGRNDEAIEAWKKAVALDPEDGFSVVHLGNLYLQRGDKSHALQVLERYATTKGERITAQEKEVIDKMIEQCKKWQNGPGTHDHGRLA
jgi:arylsulfatase A-like enzyme/Flp pilus assembly protein TadD